MNIDYTKGGNSAGLSS